VDQDRTPQELAQDAADTIQALVEATSAASAFHGEGDYVPAAPANVAATITELTVLAERLPQALRQASRALQVLEEQRQIRTADGSDVGDQVSRALRGLLDAQQAFQVGHVHLREAGAPLALLGGHYDPADDDELEDTPATR